MGGLKQDRCHSLGTSALAPSPHGDSHPGDGVILRAHEDPPAGEDTSTTGEVREPLRLVKLSLVVADILAIGLAMAAAFLMRRSLPGDEIVSETEHFSLALVSLPVWLAFLVHYRLYNLRHVSSRLEEFRRLVHAVGASVMITAAAGFMLKLEAGRSWLLLTFVFGVGALVVEREVVRRVFAALRNRGRFLRSVLIVGANVEGLALCSMLRASPGLGYRVVGFVDGGVPVGSQPLEQTPVLGTVDEVLVAVRRSKANGVIIATTAVDLETTSALARDLTGAGCHVELSSALRDIAAERLTVRGVGRFPIVYLEPVRRHGWRVIAKRVFDVAIAGAVLLVSAPFLALVVVAIKLDSEGRVLFRQQRIGKDGRPFEVLKFRTMVTEAEDLMVDLRQRNEVDGPLFKIKSDPRVTRVGRVLRSSSIDEIPQLWNVLRGEMSLVGPRPALPQEVAAWSPELHQRLLVRPGITGMWQVSGRSESSFEEYVRLDLYYVHNWSLWTDLAMLAKTIPTVLCRRGAY